MRLLEILESAPDVEVIPPSPDLFHRGLQRYIQRPDKPWTLTDCISFVVMEQRGLTEALTFLHLRLKRRGRAAMRILAIVTLNSPVSLRFSSKLAFGSIDCRLLTADYLPLTARYASFPT